MTAFDTATLPAATAVVYNNFPRSPTGSPLFIMKFCQIENPYVQVHTHTHTHTHTRTGTHTHVYAHTHNTRTNTPPPPASPPSPIQDGTRITVSPPDCAAAAKDLGSECSCGKIAFVGWNWEKAADNIGDMSSINAQATASI
jgi:hypothetical protein